MATVFVSGSRTLTALGAAAKASLDKIVAQGMDVVVGDAFGVDRAVQQYLHQLGYGRVTVYYVGDVPRNAVGKVWRAHVEGQQPAKDAHMTKIADYGLAIWDGKSPGTQANVERLRGQGKPTRVIVQG